MARTIHLTATHIAILFVVATQVQAGVISPSNYSLVSIGGGWAFGSTGWNHGVAVDNTADLATVAGLLSDGYTDDLGGPAGVTNGIYTHLAPYSGQLTFELNAVHLLEELTFVSSRALLGTIEIALEYKLGDEPWKTATTATTGSLGMYPLLLINQSPGTSFSLDFGSALADSFRIIISEGYQVSIHEVEIMGTPAASAPDPNVVPEPSSFAVFGIVAFMAGVFAWRNRREQGSAAG